MNTHAFKSLLAALAFGFVALTPPNALHAGPVTAVGGTSTARPRLPLR